MKNIFLKIKIDYLIYFLFFIAIVTGLIKNILIIFLIIIIHEFGHIFFIKLLKYDIDNIRLYPFGGVTEVCKDINSPINDDILISLGGIIFQLIIYIFGYLAFHLNLINNYTYELFILYNKTIIIFNI